MHEKVKNNFFPYLIYDSHIFSVSSSLFALCKSGADLKNMWVVDEIREKIIFYFFVLLIFLKSVFWWEDLKNV